MKAKVRFLLGFIVLIAVAIAVPLLAQDAPPGDEELVLVTGPLDLSQGDIRVNGYIIAPSSAFSPALLTQGDYVIITGYLLPDGITIQAVSLELFLTPTPSMTPTFDPNITPTLTPTTDPFATITPTITPSPTATYTATIDPTITCNQPNHPVAQRIAEAFNVTYDEVIAFHCEGFGFGEITRAYLIAQETGTTADDVLDRRRAGEGWGHIMRDSNIHPSDLAPGQAIGRGRGRGNNGNGNNGNNGNGRGNGGGNGNGNNGNGRGNGNGNN